MSLITVQDKKLRQLQGSSEVNVFRRELNYQPSLGAYHIFMMYPQMSFITNGTVQF